MSTESIIWLVVVAVVVIAIIAAVAAAANKRKKAHNRERAAEIREYATTQATKLEKHEARARETEAAAAASRAEAERKAAEAQRLEAEAAERQHVAAAHRDEHQEQLRRADELDPDVRHPAPTTTTDGAHTTTSTTGAPTTAADTHTTPSGRGVSSVRWSPRCVTTVSSAGCVPAGVACVSAAVVGAHTTTSTTGAPTTSTTGAPTTSTTGAPTTAADTHTAPTGTHPADDTVVTHRGDHLTEDTPRPDGVAETTHPAEPTSDDTAHTTGTHRA